MRTDRVCANRIFYNKQHKRVLLYYNITCTIVFLFLSLVHLRIIILSHSITLNFVVLTGPTKKQ